MAIMAPAHSKFGWIPADLGCVGGSHSVLLGKSHWDMIIFLTGTKLKGNNNNNNNNNVLQFESLQCNLRAQEY
jgi:hypothetical protein